jgi:2-enoate reductase
MGAGLIGCETALHLAQKGRKVTIAGGRRLAHDMIWANALDLIKLLDDHHVKILTNSHVHKITETGVFLANQSAVEKVDTIILAVGMQSNDKISVDTLMNKVSKVYTIGDCVQPRKILHAIEEGYRKARVI